MKCSPSSTQVIKALASCLAENDFPAKGITVFYAMCYRKHRHQVTARVFHESGEWLEVEASCPGTIDRQHAMEGLKKEVISCLLRQNEIRDLRASPDPSMNSTIKDTGTPKPSDLPSEPPSVTTESTEGKSRNGNEQPQDGRGTRSSRKSSSSLHPMVHPGPAPRINQRKLVSEALAGMEIIEKKHGKAYASSFIKKNGHGSPSIAEIPVSFLLSFMESLQEELKKY